MRRPFPLFLLALALLAGLGLRLLQLGGLSRAESLSAAWAALNPPPTPWPTWTPIPTAVVEEATPVPLPPPSGALKAAQFPFETCVVSWCEEYYSGFDQGGPVGGIVAARRSNEINYYWGLDQPTANWASSSSQVGPDNWAARFRRRIRPITPGIYRFFIYHDDGVKVLVNNVAVWPNDELWSPAGPPTTFDQFRRDVRGNEDLDIEIQFYDRDGLAYLRFWWEFEPSCELDPTGADCRRFPLFFSGWRGEYYNSPNYPSSRYLEAEWGPYETNNLTVVRDDRASGPDYPGQPGEGLYFDWAQAPPVSGIASDGWMARWTRKVEFAGGFYRFYLRTDDGGRLWLGNGGSTVWPYNNLSLVINDWRCPTGGTCPQLDPPALSNPAALGPHTVVKDLYLSPGVYLVRVDFQDIYGSATVRFWWEAR